MQQHSPVRFRTNTAPDQREAIGSATTLADELLTVKALLFAVPRDNYVVSQRFMSRVATIITKPRFNPAEPPAIAGKPAIPVTVHGGYYAEGP